jgi:hypothetical protein
MVNAERIWDLMADAERVWEIMTCAECVWDMMANTFNISSKNNLTLFM